MRTTNTSFNGRALFHALLLTVLFSLLLFLFANIEFEERVLFDVQDSSNVNAKDTSKGLMTAFAGFARPQESRFSLSGDQVEDAFGTGSLVCSKIEGESVTPFQRVWERMRSSIKKVSLISTDWAKDLRSMKNFTDWVDESMSYFTFSRLQHTSISRPIDQARSIGRIHSILEEKMKFPKTSPPLRIVVFGGSVTTGQSCMDNIFDLLVRSDGKGNERRNTPVAQTKECAWSGRLQEMMDEIFGLGVVDIQNLAVGGATSDVSIAFMEFGLIPDSTPDIIIWDHGVNDAMTMNNPNVKYGGSPNINTEQIFEKLQRFYQAALALPTSCDKPDPPLVIMLDVLLGQQGRLPHISVALRVSNAISKMLAWYPDVWGISSANTIRPYILTRVSNEKNMIGLLGSNEVTTHPGMMYHISIAWVIMFNFLNALHDNCISRDIFEATRSSTEVSTPINESEYLQLSHIPELHAELRMLDIPELWRERIPEPMDYESCLEKQSIKTEAIKKFTNDSSLTCYYVWIVNSMVSIYSSSDIFAKIEPYLASNEGWSAYDSDSKTNPGGWIPVGGSGSLFALQFTDVPTTVNSLTIVSMQSYSEMWINSTLQIDCIFFNSSSDISTDFLEQIETNATQILDGNYSSDMINSTEPFTAIRHFISGYHDDETSILVPVKLPLPDRTLEEEKSSLLLHFRLLDGETFKIAGMALC